MMNTSKSSGIRNYKTSIINQSFKKVHVRTYVHVAVQATITSQGRGSDSGTSMHKEI